MGERIHGESFYVRFATLKGAVMHVCGFRYGCGFKQSISIVTPIVTATATVTAKPLLGSFSCGSIHTEKKI